MAGLPDPDSPEFRLLVLRGRQQSVQEATEALQRQFAGVETDAPFADLAVVYADGVRAYGHWLYEQSREVSSELDLIAAELGIVLPDGE